MTKETADLISKTSTQCGLRIEVIPNYSGRNMFGATTVALTYSREEHLTEAFARAILKLQEKSTEEVVENFLAEVLNFRKDQLGQGFVAY